MSNQEKPKKEPLRIILFILSMLFIVFLWVRKDVVNIYTTMPKEQIAPLIITTILVSLLKIGLIAGAVFLIKFIIDKKKK